MASSSLVSEHPEIAPLLGERVQRAKVIQAMVDVVAEKSYAAATVADAVRRARVSRGTFYALFESKEACLGAGHRLGTEALERRVSDAVRDADDWREELRLGIRAYLTALEADDNFARVYLLEAPAVATEHEAGLRRFASRYGKSFARSGRPVPPDDALFVLAAGVHELVRARLRDGLRVTELEDTLTGCAVRFVAKEEQWT
jgi:AcrR family transcriptional regulator